MLQFCICITLGSCSWKIMEAVIHSAGLSPLIDVWSVPVAFSPDKASSVSWLLSRRCTTSIVSLTVAVFRSSAYLWNLSGYESTWECPDKQGKWNTISEGRLKPYLYPYYGKQLRGVVAYAHLPLFNEKDKYWIDHSVPPSCFWSKNHPVSLSHISMPTVFFPEAGVRANAGDSINLALHVVSKAPISSSANLWTVCGYPFGIFLFSPTAPRAGFRNKRRKTSQKL